MWRKQKCALRLRVLLENTQHCRQVPSAGSVVPNKMTNEHNAVASLPSRPHAELRSTSRNAGTLAYVPALDGLRALAVLAVLVSHYGLGHALSPLERLLPWGHMGVYLFFVLSGLLITSILLEYRDHTSNFTELKHALKTFYARRALRIFPAYYATILLFLIFGAEEFKSVIVYHIFYLSNTVAATSIEDGLIHPSSAHFWSLSVEEQFYLFWPLVILTVPRRHLPLIGLCLIFVAPVTRASLFLTGYTHVVGYLPTATDALAAGSLLAILRAGQLPDTIASYLKPLVVVAIVGFLLSLISFNLGVWYRPREVLFPIFEAIVYAALINLILKEQVPKVNQILSWSPLVEIGKVSYAVYLTHTFVIDSIKYIFPSFDKLPGFAGFVIATLATVALALASWRFFEGPINRRKSMYQHPRVATQ
jgi:peptidoglycan/LPS O-acetylase OafA/YrhL